MAATRRTRRPGRASAGADETARTRGTLPAAGDRCRRCDVRARTPGSKPRRRQSSAKSERAATCPRMSPQSARLSAASARPTRRRAVDAARATSTRSGCSRDRARDPPGRPRCRNCAIRSSATTASMPSSARTVEAPSRATQRCAQRSRGALRGPNRTGQALAPVGDQHARASRRWRRLRCRSAGLRGRRSTCTRSPCGISRVASATPTTDGMPNSRAMIAPCDSMPPRSMTRPAMSGKTGTPARIGLPRDEHVAGAQLVRLGHVGEHRGAAAASSAAHAEAAQLLRRRRCLDESRPAQVPAGRDADTSGRYSPSRRANVSGGVIALSSACAAPAQRHQFAEVMRETFAPPASSSSSSSTVRKNTSSAARAVRRRTGDRRAPARRGADGCRGGPASAARARAAGSTAASSGAGARPVPLMDDRHEPDQPPSSKQPQPRAPCRAARSARCTLEVLRRRVAVARGVGLEMSMSAAGCSWKLGDRQHQLAGTAEAPVVEEAVERARERGERRIAAGSRRARPASARSRRGRAAAIGADHARQLPQLHRRHAARQTRQRLEQAVVQRGLLVGRKRRAEQPL